MKYYLFGSVLTVTVVAVCVVEAKKLGGKSINPGTINPVSFSLITNASKSNQLKPSQPPSASSQMSGGGQNTSPSSGGEHLKSSADLGLIVSDISTEEQTAALNAISPGANVPTATQHGSVMGGNTPSGAIAAKNQLARALSQTSPQTKAPQKKDGAKKKILPKEGMVQVGAYLGKLEKPSDAKPGKLLDKIRNGPRV